MTFRDGAQAAFADLQSEITKRDAASAALAVAGLAELKAALDRAVRTPRSVPSTDDVERVTERTDKALRKAMPSGVAGGDRRVGLRPDRAHPRSHGGFGGRRPVPAGRAGAARGLRLLRVRARAAPEVVRPRDGDRHRGADLVRVRRHARARGADRRPRAAAPDPQDAHRARRAPGGCRGDAGRQREPRDGDHELGDHRLPRGPGGGPDPGGDHRIVRRRAAADAASGAARRRPRAAGRP